MRFRALKIAAMIAASTGSPVTVEPVNLPAPAPDLPPTVVWGVRDGSRLYVPLFGKIRLISYIAGSDTGYITADFTGPWRETIRNLMD